MSDQKNLKDNAEAAAKKAAEEAALAEAAAKKAAEEKAAADAAAAAQAQVDNTLSGKAGVKLGDTVHLRAVHGRMVHPEAPFTEFDTNTSQKVKFDWWHKIQFDAGKLELS